MSRYPVNCSSTAQRYEAPDKGEAGPVQSGSCLLLLHQLAHVAATHGLASTLPLTLKAVFLSWEP